MPSSPDSLTPEQIRELEKKAAEAEKAEREAIERGMEWLAAPKQEVPQEFLEAFDKWAEVHEVEQRIRARELLRPATHAEMDSQERAIAELVAERERLVVLALGNEPPAPLPVSVSEPEQQAAPTGRKRQDALAPLIAKAQREACSQDDAAEVFSILKTWANSEKPPAPLRGGMSQDGGSILWENHQGELEKLSREALSKRLRRRSKPDAKGR